MGAELTDAFCRTAGPGDHHDGDGLVLRVGKTSKTRTLVRRQKDRVRKIRIGPYPSIGIKEAQSKARSMQARLDRGLPPYEMPEPAPMVAPPAPPPKPAGPTVRDLLDIYIRHHVRPNAEDAPQVEWVVNTLLAPFHARPAAEVIRRRSLRH